ncbi:MAG: periplasmic heavy metal sensor [Myxococcales bacterium]|nr:periplasmic heavy metal sensor [Myxococcales bacterium]MCB9708517.1 periplasmic heavy metal sensor [Myxococcales bacterium]
MIRKTTLGFLLSLGALALTPVVGLAETPPSDARPEWTPEQKLAHIKEMRGKMLREQVGLDETRAAKLEKSLASFDAEHLKYRTQMNDARHQTRALLDSKSTDEKAYRAQVNKQRAAFKQLHSLKEREWNRIAAELSPKEQALLLMSLGNMKHFGKKCCAKEGCCQAKAGQCGRCARPKPATPGGIMLPPPRRSPGASKQPVPVQGRRVAPGKIGPTTGPGPAPAK